MWVYFWALYSVPLIYVSLFMPVMYCFDDCSFVVRECDSSSSVLLSQDCFGYSGSSVFPYDFKIICSISVKNALGILIGIALNL